MNEIRSFGWNHATIEKKNTKLVLRRKTYVWCFDCAVRLKSWMYSTFEVLNVKYVWHSGCDVRLKSWMWSTFDVLNVQYVWSLGCEVRKFATNNLRHVTFTLKKIYHKTENWKLSLKNLLWNYPLDVKCF